MSTKIAGSAYIELKAKMDSLESNIKSEVRKIGNKGGQSFSQGFSSQLGPLKSAIAGVVSVSAMVLFGKQILTLASQVQQAKISFDKLTESEERSLKLLEDIKTFAVNTPFDQMGLIDGAKKLMVYGFQAEQIIPIMNSLGDAVAAAGGGQDVMNGVIVALGQMQTKGKVVTQELRQMAERGIPVFDILKEKLNLTSEQVMEIGDQGISAAQAIPALLEGINERFGGVMEEQAKTIQGRWSNLVDITKITLADIGLNVADTTSNAISNIANMLTENTDDIVAFTGNILDATTEISKLIIDIIKEIAEGWELLFQGLGELFNEAGKQNSDITTGIRGDWTDLGYFFLNGITAIIGAIKIAVVAVNGYVGGMFNFLQEGSDAVAGSIIHIFGGAFNSVGNFFGYLVDNIMNGFMDIVNGVISGVNWMGEQLNKVLPGSMEVGVIDTFDVQYTKRGNMNDGAWDKANEYKDKLSDVRKNSFADANSEIKREQENLIDNLLDNYETRLNQNLDARMGGYTNTVSTSLDGIFGGDAGSSPKGEGNSGGQGDGITEEQKKEIVKNYEDLGDAVSDHLEKLDDYKDKISDIGNEFENLKKTAKNTFAEIQNFLQELDEDQNQSLMDSYYDIQEKMEEIIDKNNGIDKASSRIKKETLKNMNKDSEFSGFTVEELLEYKELQEELNFITSKTTQEQRKQAEANNLLSDSEREYNEYLKERNVLLEKQNIANAFASMENLDIQGASDIKVTAKINDGGELEASYWDDLKNEYVKITDFKNMQYAQELFDKQMALMQEKEELEIKVENETAIYKGLQEEKMSMEVQYTSFLKTEIQKQVGFVDGLIAKYKEMASIKNSTVGGSDLNGRAFGGNVNAGMPYLIGENFKPELFIPSSSGSVVPVNNYNTSKNINVDIGKVVADNPVDFAGMMRDNLGNYL